MEATDTDDAPWHIVRSDDKRRARLNYISYSLSLIPYEKVHREKVKLSRRSKKGEYDDQTVLSAFAAGLRRLPGRARGSEGQAPDTIKQRLQLPHKALIWAHCPRRAPAGQRRI